MRHTGMYVCGGVRSGHWKGWGELKKGKRIVEERRGEDEYVKGVIHVGDTVSVWDEHKIRINVSFRRR